MFVECRIKRQPAQKGPAPIKIWTTENCNQLLAPFGVVIFTRTLWAMSCQNGRTSIAEFAELNLKLLS